MVVTLRNHVNFLCLLRFNLPWTEHWLLQLLLELNPLEAPRSTKSVWAAAAVTKVFLPRGHCIPSELVYWEKSCWMFQGSWSFWIAGCHVIHLPSVFCHYYYPLYVRCQKTKVQIQIVLTYVLGAEAQKNHFPYPRWFSLEKFLISMIIYLDLCTVRAPSKIDPIRSRVAHVVAILLDYPDCLRGSFCWLCFFTLATGDI